MSDPKCIAEGRVIATNLQAKIQGEGWTAADKYLATLPEGSRVSLDAYREHELKSLVGRVELSETGADIRWEEASALYRKMVAATMAQSLEKNQ